MHIHFFVFRFNSPILGGALLAEKQKTCFFNIWQWQQPQTCASNRAQAAGQVAAQSVPQRSPKPGHRCKYVGCKCQAFHAKQARASELNYCDFTIAKLKMSDTIQAQVS